MTPLRQRMTDDMQIRNFSPRTIECYTYHVGRFAKFFGKSPEQLGAEEVRTYQLHLVQERKVGWSSFNQAVCALRFLYRHTLPRDWHVEMIPFGKKPKTLPAVLSGEEVHQLFECVRPIKQRTVFFTLYAAGLRLSEALQLRVTDIDSRRMQLLVAHGKGNKQRLVPLSPRLLEALRQYWNELRPDSYLFPGKTNDRPLSGTVIQKGLQAGGATSRPEQTRDATHVASQLCDGTFGSACRPVDDRAVAWPSEIQFDFDLPARPTTSPDLHAQSPRLAAGGAMPTMDATWGGSGESVRRVNHPTASDRRLSCPT